MKMDYEKLIEENEFLKAYFTEFPKKLMQLAKEGKVISFFGNGILICYQNIHDHLQSPKSLFPGCTLMDFFETLHVLQFSRSSHAKKTSDTSKVYYVFINPNFSCDNPVPDDFYKLPIDITNCHLLKGTKRMTNIHNIGLFNRLLDRASKQEQQISRLQYARMRINYEFQRAANLKCYEIDVIEHDVNEPQYLKEYEIAGYYGNVSLDALKTGFCSYFPIYQTDAATNDNQHEDEGIQEIIDINNNVQEIEIIVDDMPAEQQHYQVPIMNDDVAISDKEEGDSNKENKEPSRKRKRKPYTKKSAKITKRETADALSNLQKLMH